VGLLVPNWWILVQLFSHQTMAFSEEKSWLKVLTSLEQLGNVWQNAMQIWREIWLEPLSQL
jgi:hypothetical protein